MTSRQLLVWVPLYNPSPKLHITDIYDISVIIKGSFLRDIYPPINYDDLFNISKKNRSNYSNLKELVLNNYESIDSLFENKESNTLFSHPFLDLQHLDTFLSKTHINNLRNVKMFIIYEDFDVAFSKIEYYNRLMQQLINK